MYKTTPMENRVPSFFAQDGQCLEDAFGAGAGGLHFNAGYTSVNAFEHQVDFESVAVAEVVEPRF